MANLLRFLYQQRIAGFGVPAEPQFDPASTLAFLALLDRARVYLEFGAGGSTLAAARRGIETLSIDSDRWFADAVRRALPEGARSRVLAAPVGFTREWGYPVFKRPSPGRVRRWRRYIELPFEELARGGGFPDLILVDGRFRRACALESARQARRAGKTATLLFDDYAERDHYHAVERHLGPPRMAGRAAIFALGAEVEVPRAAIDEAIRDCR